MTLYVNLTYVIADGAAAWNVKACLRNRIAERGMEIASIERNPFTPGGHRYRFIRIKLRTKS